MQQTYFAYTNEDIQKLAQKTLLLYLLLSFPYILNIIKSNASYIFLLFCYFFYLNNLTSTINILRFKYSFTILYRTRQSHCPYNLLISFPLLSLLPLVSLSLPSSTRSTSPKASSTETTKSSTKASSSISSSTMSIRIVSYYGLCMNHHPPHSQQDRKKE